MRRLSAREEKWAVINKENRVRVLLTTEQAAQQVAFNLSRALAGTGPYRVALVRVEEVTDE